MTCLSPMVTKAGCVLGVAMVMQHTTGVTSVGALLFSAEISAIHFTVSPHDMPVTGKLFATPGGGDKVSYQGTAPVDELFSGVTPLYDVQVGDSAPASSPASPQLSPQTLEARLIDRAKIKPGPIAYLGLGLITLAMMRLYQRQPKKPKTKAYK